MNYFLIKMSFDTAVHFGASDSAQSLSTVNDHILADTLFSALCHTALQIGGEDTLQMLCKWVQDGEMLLSDTMPWRGKDCFLPKPYVHSDSRKEVSAAKRKGMKKLSWIPVRSFTDFSESVRGGDAFDPAEYQVFFGTEQEMVRAAVTEGEDARPYRVGAYQFAENCGLYVIAALKTEQQQQILIQLMNVLGMGGIGGKISSGYGKFHLQDQICLNHGRDEQEKWMYHALTQTRGRQLLLSASLPKEDELYAVLDDAFYQLVRRSGFVASETYADTPMKKKTQYYLRAGSMLSCRFAGDLYTVGTKGKHAVYRYGKPLFMGVDL